MQRHFIQMTSFQRWKPVGCYLLLVFFLLPTSLKAKSPRMSYPKTAKVDQVDDYHGTRVADPYRWLEEDVRESKRVEEWVEAENKVTSTYLTSLPQRKPIHNLLERLWNYEKFGTPFKAGGRYCFYKNDGLQNQYVLYTQETLDDEPRVLIDPNKWSEDGTIALAGTAFSDDGRYVAYGIQESGSDWRSRRILEIKTGKVLDDDIKWIKFSGVSWKKDSSGFYYGRYQEPKEGEAFPECRVHIDFVIHHFCKTNNVPPL